MLDFDPELSVAVEGKEILVTLPGGQLRRHVLAPRPQPPARLNIVFVERSVGRARRLHLGIRPQTDPTGVSRAPSTSNAHDGGKIGSTA